MTRQCVSRPTSNLSLPEHRGRQDPVPPSDKQPPHSRPIVASADRSCKSSLTSMGHSVRWRDVLSPAADSIGTPVVDPPFADAENGDHRRPPESPAFSLGFQPVARCSSGSSSRTPTLLLPVRLRAVLNVTLGEATCCRVEEALRMREARLVFPWNNRRRETPPGAVERCWRKTARLRPTNSLLGRQTRRAVRPRHRDARPGRHGGPLPPCLE